MKAKQLKSFLDAIDPECDIFFSLSRYISKDRREKFAKAILRGGWEDVNSLEEHGIEYREIGRGAAEYLTIDLFPVDLSDIDHFANVFDKEFKIQKICV